MQGLWKKARKRAAIMYGQQIADDIAQDVILAYLLYEKKHGKSSRQSIDQAVIDSYRRLTGMVRSKSPPIMLSFDEDEFPLLPIGFELPTYDELRGILDASIHKLTPRQRKCVTLTLGGLKQREIGKVMKVSQVRVGQLLKQAVEVVQLEIRGLD